MRSLSLWFVLFAMTVAPPLAAQSTTKLLAVQFGIDEANAILAFYPTRDIEKNRSAAAVIKLTNAPNGKLIACNLVEQVGDPGLASRVCGFAKRVKWKPARDREGQAAFGVITTVVSLFIPDTPQGDLVRQTRREPDVIAKSALANSFIASGGVEVKVSLQIDPSASFVACEPVVPVEATLVKEACGIASRLKFEGLNDQAGAPVTYVTERRVRLVPDNAAPAQR